jgi:hypothetical protein
MVTDPDPLPFFARLENLSRLFPNPTEERPMPKLRLDIDALAVESFVPALDASSAPGTVLARGTTIQPTRPIPPTDTTCDTGGGGSDNIICFSISPCVPTVPDSCVGTCYQTCAYSCGQSCPNTCAGVTCAVLPNQCA